MANIKKHSNNLIDLIEIDDIVKVKNKETEEIYNLEMKDETILAQLENNFEEILEVLTHEQYEENCYKTN